MHFFPAMSFLRIANLLALSGICVLGHFFCPPEYTTIHEFLFKLTYLPIVLAALWGSRKLALTLTALFCLVYVFHIFEHLFHHGYPHIFSSLMELVLYFLVAWIVGGLGDEQKTHSQKLTEAYSSLKEKTAMLLEFEQHALKNERMKTMGELAGTIAHEIRTPLSALQGAVEIVCTPSTDAPTREHFGSMIYKEVARLNQVVQDFLNIGRQVPLNLESVNLVEIAKACIDLLSPIASKKGITLHLERSQDIFGMARADQLTQVFLNLMMNSITAIGATNGQVWIKLKMLEGNCHIEVEDTGRGVDPSVQSRLFEPFATGHKEGTGLGLYLSRNLVRSFGGDLSYDKQQSSVTRFVLTLPSVS